MIRWRAVAGFIVMVLAAIGLGIHASSGAPMNGLTVVGYIAFGFGLIAFVFHRAPRRIEKGKHGHHS